MLYTTLGQSSLHISRVGFGCMSLEQNGLAKLTLLKAVERGVNFFDTADLYDKGLNEVLVGQALKGLRNKVILATKVGNVWRTDGSGWDWNASKAHILKAINDSLKRLQTDHMDLYQLHGGTLEDPIDETIEAFELLIKQGKIRYYGISSIRPNVIRKWVEQSNITSVMLQYSLLDRRPEEIVMPLLNEKGIGILVRGSVAQGLLVNKPAKPYLDYSESQVSAMRQLIDQLSIGQRSSLQTSLQFVLQNYSVAATVLGIRTMEQLDDAMKVFDKADLSNEELNTLSNALPLNFYKEHR